MEAAQLMVLRSFGYRHEAEFAKFALESASIPSVLLADDAGGAEAGLSFANPARLMVRREDIDAAARIVMHLGLAE